MKHIRLIKLIKPIFAIVLAAIFASNSFAAKSIDVAKNNPKDKLSELQTKIQALKNALDHNQKAHIDATDALKTSETAISVANQKLLIINKQQKQNKTTLKTLGQQSLNLNENLNTQQKRLNELVNQQYRRGIQSYSRLLLQNKNPSQIARELKYFSYIAKAHAELIDDTQHNLIKVNTLNNQTSLTLKKVAELKSLQEQERNELQVQKKEKSRVVKSLSSEISAQRSEINKLKRDEKSLSNLVEQLAKIVIRPAKKKNSSPNKTLSAKKTVLTKNTGVNKKTEVDENIVPSNQQHTGDPVNIANANTVPLTNEETPANGAGNNEFSALKGKLRLPVRGELLNRFGSNRMDTGVSWKGLFIKAAEGSEVKSVAKGTVVFADWMRGFGNLIIVDHGSGFMSLYGNNQAILRQVGETVNAGDQIAAVGNTGGNETNGLYYELRRQSKPFDPLSWSVIR